ncbi:MAG: hypothetical protein ACYTGQ_06960, partial [Planctomycetota bacterium]
AEQQGAPTQPHRFFLHRRWAVAALLFISACITWEIHLLQDVSVPVKLLAIRQPTMMEAFDKTTGILANGIWTQTDDQDIAESLRWRLGQALRIKGLDETVQLIGKAHLHGISSQTLSLLFKVDDEDAIVFIDRVDQDQAQFMTEQRAGLNIYRRYLGEKFVLFEVTPHDVPKVIGKFYEAGI